MKITKTANGKQKIKISHNEWKNIGKKAGWIRTSGNPSQLEFKFALVYKVTPPAIGGQLPEGFTPVSVSHITLIGGKFLKPYKTQLSQLLNTINNYPELQTIPDPVFGEQIVAKRTDGRESVVVAVQNQGEFTNYVNLLCQTLGVTNPEPGRFFHLTLANNAGGDPFKSIGDINASDF